MLGSLESDGGCSLQKYPPKDETDRQRNHPGNDDTASDPQATARRFFTVPTPIMAPLIACVVLIGTPNRVAISITVPAAVSAANPWAASSLTNLKPIVLTIRKPPAAVPSPIESAAAIIT